MELLRDGIIAFLSAVGLTACVWLTVGAVLGLGKCRRSDVRLVLPARDEAASLEMDLRELIRIRRAIPGASIVVEDCGLSEEGRCLAEYLCRRYDRVELRNRES